MRIIAGRHKGRVLKAPTWDELRPTSDKLRETLFNILSPHVEGARMLDVFAGTGAFALEALSRGAVSAVCVEQDRRAVAIIEENRTRCSEAARALVVCDTAERALSRPLAGGPFDIIVLDPPYGQAGVDAVVALAAAQRAAGGILVLEHAARTSPPVPAGLSIARTVRSGDSALTFYA